MKFFLHSVGFRLSFNFIGKDACQPFLLEMPENLYESTIINDDINFLFTITSMVSFVVVLLNLFPLFSLNIIFIGLFLLF